GATPRGALRLPRDPHSLVPLPLPPYQTATNKRYTATRIAYIRKSGIIGEKKDRLCCFGVGDCGAFTSEAYDDEREGEGRGWR
ncbi:hypothetical protein BHE74_00056084, partial [Ensete ventricosum]